MALTVLVVSVSILNGLSVRMYEDELTQQLLSIAGVETAERQRETCAVRTNGSPTKFAGWNRWATKAIRNGAALLGRIVRGDRG